MAIFFFNIAVPCHVRPEDRNSCGWYGIEKNTCKGRGCCYDDTVKNATHCFYPAG